MKPSHLQRRSRRARGTALINVIILVMISTVVVTLLLVANTNLAGQTRGAVEVAHVRFGARGAVSAVTAYLNAPSQAGDPYQPTAAGTQFPTGMWEEGGAAGVDYMVLVGTETSITLLDPTTATGWFETAAGTAAVWKSQVRPTLMADSTTTWAARVEYRTTTNGDYYYHVYALSKAEQAGVSDSRDPVVRSAQAALVPDQTNPFAYSLGTGREGVVIKGNGILKVRGATTGVGALGTNGSWDFSAGP